MKHLPGSDPAARSMCKRCLILLSIPTAHRETITHASAVLIHLATASWRANHRCPTLVGTLDTTDLSDAPSTVSVGGGSSCEPSGARGGCVNPASPAVERLAASTIMGSFFPDRDQSTDVNDMSVLVASFMPLPPRSSLAVCHALVHVVQPSVLLASCDVKNCQTDTAVESKGKGNLLFGPILRVIMRCGGAKSELQLRFFALQVRKGRREK